jgi:VWFA-related protein
MKPAPHQAPRPARQAVAAALAVAGPLLLSGEVLAGSPQQAFNLGPEVIKVEGDPPERIELAVSVTDRYGRPVIGLKGSDFLIKEGGVPQTLIDFGREADRQDRPLSIVFLVDRSGSIGRQMGKWRQACTELVGSLRPIDKVKVSTFTTEVRTLQDFTGDGALLASAVEEFEPPGGGTRIFRAVDETLHDLRRRAGRKVVFLLTDGLDNEFPEAWTTYGDSYLTHLVKLAVHSQVTIVTILPGPTGRPFLAAQDLATQTGGWWLYPSDDLAGLIRKLGERLLESYYLVYDSTWPLDDRSRRHVEVTIDSPPEEGISVRTVDGVFGGIPLLEILVEELKESDAADRAHAAASLAFIQDRDAARPLRKALNDESPSVRARAAESIGQRGDERAVRQLGRLLEDPDEDVRKAAMEALERLLEGADEETRGRILDALEPGN